MLYATRWENRAPDTLFDRIVFDGGDSAAAPILLAITGIEA